MSDHRLEAPRRTKRDNVIDVIAMLRSRSLAVARKEF